MRECHDFVDRRALIFSVDDYSLTRLVEGSFGDLPATRADAAHAEQLALGFGVPRKNITHIHNMEKKTINKFVTNLKKDLRALA